MSRACLGTELAREEPSRCALTNATSMPIWAGSIGPIDDVLGGTFCASEPPRKLSTSHRDISAARAVVEAMARDREHGDALALRGYPALSARGLGRSRDVRRQPQRVPGRAPPERHGRGVRDWRRLRSHRVEANALAGPRMQTRHRSAARRLRQPLPSCRPSNAPLTPLTEARQRETSERMRSVSLGLRGRRAWGECPLLEAVWRSVDGGFGRLGSR